MQERIETLFALSISLSLKTGKEKHPPQQVLFLFYRRSSFRTRSETSSTWVVWGNMSTGWTLTRV